MQNTRKKSCVDDAIWAHALFSLLCFSFFAQATIFSDYHNIFHQI
jgi:hypothetical protein